MLALYHWAQEQEELHLKLHPQLLTDKMLFFLSQLVRMQSWMCSRRSSRRISPAPRATTSTVRTPSTRTVDEDHLYRYHVTLDLSLSTKKLLALDSRALDVAADTRRTLETTGADLVRMELLLDQEELHLDQEEPHVDEDVDVGVDELVFAWPKRASV